MPRTCEQCGINPLSRKQKQFCSRTCYETQRRTRPHTADCAVCSKPFAPYRITAKFCSVHCANLSRRKHEERNCLVCDIAFYSKDKAKRCCSLDCRNAFIKRAPKPCEGCGNLISSTRNRHIRYCSKACYQAHRQLKPRSICPVCGEPTKDYGRIFCSQQCFSKNQIKPQPPCKTCGKPIHAKSVLFCSKPCAAIARTLPPVSCAKCGIKLDVRKNKYCAVCRTTPGVAKSKHSADTIAKIIELRDRGMIIADVAMALGMTRGQVHGLATRQNIKFDRRVATPKPRIPKPTKGYYSFKPKTPKLSKPRIPGIPIALREVYQWGMQLNVPLSKRGDISAVSAAMRREDPTHPGFRLRESVKTAWRI